MKLDELATEEIRLLNIVDKTTGVMEEQARLLQEKGIFEVYCDIHKSYVELANFDNNLESLKRAVLLD